MITLTNGKKDECPLYDIDYATADYSIYCEISSRLAAFVLPTKPRNPETYGWLDQFTVSSQIICPPQKGNIVEFNVGTSRTIQRKCTENVWGVNGVPWN